MPSSPRLICPVYEAQRNVCWRELIVPQLILSINYLSPQGAPSRWPSDPRSRPKVPAERPGVLPAERPGVLPGERESIRLFCKNPFQPAASSLQADLTMKNPSRRMEHAGSIRLFLFFSQKQTNTEAAFAQHIVPARGFVPQERMFYGRGGLG